MADFKEVKIENKIVYAPPMITDDPLVVDKGYTFVNREGKKDYLNAILGYKLENSAAIFRVETWRNRTALVKLTFHSEAAFSFQMFPFERVPEKLNSVFEFPVYDQVELKEEGDSVVFSTARTRLVIRKNPWEMVVELDGKEITREQIRDFNVDQRYKGIPVGFTVDRWGNVSDCFETMYLHSDEDFYGFGEKFTDFNKRGQKITVWQRDAQSTSADVSYKGMPYFMSTYGYSIAVNTYTRNHFNMGASSAVSYNMEVEDPYLDYYMFCNRDYKELVSDYTALSGRSPMVPKWSFGFWITMISYRGTVHTDKYDVPTSFRRSMDGTVYDAADAMEKFGMPVDVFHFDGGSWQTWDAYDILTDGNASYPDVEEMVRSLKERGIHTCLWMNPYVRVRAKRMNGANPGPAGSAEDMAISEQFKHLRELGYLVMDPKTNEPYMFSSGEGDPNNMGSSAVDLTNPEAYEYMKNRVARLMEMGTGVIKTDFGEEIPQDAQFYDGTTGVQSHNKFTALYQQCVYEGTCEGKKKWGDEPGMLWGRSGYLGNQRYPANWAGDSFTSLNTQAAVLNGGLSMAVSGVPFWGFDMGGFYGSTLSGDRDDPTDEEYVRSVQLGFFSPLSRAHGQWSPRVPWKYGKEAQDAFLKADKLRYRLLPYIYHVAIQSHEKGYPMIRPMVMEFQEDRSVRNMSRQYMYGDSLLVAPTFDQQQQYVYLPKGSWIDYNTGDRLEGVDWIATDMALDKIPLYIRQDKGLVELIDIPLHIDGKQWSNLRLVLNLVHGIKGEYKDDGIAATYEAALQNGTVTITFGEMDVTCIQLYAKEEVTKAVVNGTEWTVRKDGNAYLIEK